MYTTNNFDSLFNSLWENWGNGNTTKYPPVDVYETETAFILEAELPGYDENDVTVNVEKNVLRIASEKGKAVREGDYLVKEIKSTAFERKFALPKEIDESKIEAKFENGILVITMPKLPVAQPRKISIKLQ